MTKSEKWEIIGEAFLTLYEERTDKQKDLTGGGLCFACLYFRMKKFNYKFWGNKYRCRRKLIPINYKKEYYYAPVRDLEFIKFRPIHDIQRGMFALLMSEAVKTEENW